MLGPLHRAAGVDRPREPHVLGVRPRQRRRREGALAAREAGLAGRREVGCPHLLGQHVAVVRRGGRCRRAAPRAAPSRPASSSYSPRSPPKIGQLRPIVTLFAQPRSGSREADVPLAAVLLLAVAVEVEAVPEVRPLGVADAELLVDHARACCARRRVVGALDAEPHELEEARVDDLALVDRRAAVADVVRRARVRVRRPSSGAGSTAAASSGPFVVAVQPSTRFCQSSAVAR